MTKYWNFQQRNRISELINTVNKVVKVFTRDRKQEQEKYYDLRLEFVLFLAKSGKRQKYGNFSKNTVPKTAHLKHGHVLVNTDVWILLCLARVPCHESNTILLAKGLKLYNLYTPERNSKRYKTNFLTVLQKNKLNIYFTLENSKKCNTDIF